MHYVFVYGSLKRDYHNHGLLKQQVYVGHGVTKDKDWQMYSLRSFPGVVRGNKQITGELYYVEDLCFEYLDALEGHPTFYKRAQVPVVVDDKEYVAWMYIYQGDVSTLKAVEGW